MVQSPNITPERIDDYLAQGWFRFGGTMRTTRFTVWEETSLRTTLWMRTNLENFAWSKSNRKLLAKIRRRYRIEVVPISLDDAHEALYTRYCAHVGGERPHTLRDFLGGEDDIGRYRTWELNIFDGDRLVAFSLFDLGNTSVMSLLGAFDPSVASDSLGYGSMALEADLALKRGMKFHYSGYVLPGEPRMDYKHRIGGMEFLDPDTAVWRPWSEFDANRLPDARMRSALDIMGQELGLRGVRSRRLLNPLFELADSPIIQQRMVAQPLLLMVHTRRAPFPIVTWDDEALEYQVWSGLPAIIRHRRVEDGPERSTATALIEGELASGIDPALLADTICSHLDPGA